MEEKIKKVKELIAKGCNECHMNEQQISMLQNNNKLLNAICGIEQQRFISKNLPKNTYKTIWFKSMMLIWCYEYCSIDLIKKETNTSQVSGIIDTLRLTKGHIFAEQKGKHRTDYMLTKNGKKYIKMIGWRLPPVIKPYFVQCDTSHLQHFLNSEPSYISGMQATHVGHRTKQRVYQENNEFEPVLTNENVDNKTCYNDFYPITASDNKLNSDICDLCKKEGCPKYPPFVDNILNFFNIHKSKFENQKRSKKICKESICYHYDWKLLLEEIKRKSCDRTQQNL